MIDEKKLQQLARFATNEQFQSGFWFYRQELIRLSRLGLQWENEVKTGITASNPEREKQHLATVSRLISLGMWADKHAIPALEKIAPEPPGCDAAWFAKEALAALPREDK